MLGRRIGRFVVERALGAGGMGAVFAARDEVLDRLVALKVLPSAVEGDPDRRARLLREARSAAALSHPNVAIVYEAGVDEGQDTVFLAMELVEGESLASRLARGPLSLEEWLTIGAGIARGLAAAHAVSVIHRDLKPANVMLATDGTPKLVDFGLARPPRAEPTSRESFTGLVVGTPGYMAPEQLRGEAVDPRTDLFALGVVLHEMWSGRPPFGDSGLSAMALTLHEEAPSLGAVRPGAPPDLAELVAHLLAKEPASRPASTREVVQRLGALAPRREGDARAAGEIVARAAPSVAQAIAPTIEVVRASRRPVESEAMLLGRDPEVAAIEAELERGTRVLTIAGAPGIGKSTLATHLAARLRARGRRVTSVSLGPIATLDELRAALVLALRPASSTATLTELLAIEDSLVFLDGGEATSRELAAELPTWLAASRARFVLSRRNELAIEAEQVMRLGPLPHAAAREVFLSRARRARALFAPSADDLAAIDGIIEALDASPLALVLAASRVGLLSPREIVLRLGAGDEARLALLHDRRATGSIGSLREAIAWSFALLSPEEGRVLARLALFESPFTTESAERVASLPGEVPDSLAVLDALESARVASLVRTEHDARGGVRSVLEPNVRAFARSRLRDDPRATAVEEAFVHQLGVIARAGVLEGGHAGRLVAEDGPSLRAAVRLGRDRPGLTIPALWIATLLAGQGPEAEIEQALEHMLVEHTRGRSVPLDLLVHAELALYQRMSERDIEQALVRARTIVARAEMLADPDLLALARGTFFDGLVRAQRLDEAEAIATRLLEAARSRGSAAHEIDAHERLGVIAWRRSRPEEAVTSLARALALAESLRDRRRQAAVLQSLGILCVQRRLFVDARAYYERSRELARAEHLPRMVATLANNLGVVHHEEDRLEDARASFEEAAEQASRGGMAMLLGVARGNAGMVEHEQGRLAAARLSLDTGIRVLASIGDTRFRAVFLGARAALHADERALDAAREDLAAAGALLERAFEPQLALALSIRSAHVELASARAGADPTALARASAEAEAHLAELAAPTSITVRSDLARMALRALARAS